MKNWKTTLGGLLAAAGQYLAANDNAWVHLIGQVVSGLGLILLGAAAQDKK